jgi:hypothetical protein
MVSRDSTVGVATGYWLDDQGVGVRVAVGQEFSLPHVFPRQRNEFSRPLISVL